MTTDYGAALAMVAKDEILPAEIPIDEWFDNCLAQIKESFWDYLGKHP